MATLKTLEIDTLKIRTLQVTAKDNIFYPLDFQLFSKGDGTTYWSTSVAAIQFINLSTTVSTNQTLNINNLSSLTSELYSTLYGFSTLAYNLSTYEICLKYTDAQVGNLSSQLTSYIINTYETQGAADLMQALLTSNINQVSNNLTAVTSTLSTQIDYTNYKLETQSTFIQSQLVEANSTFMASTFTGLKQISAENKLLFEQALINNAVYLDGNIVYNSTTVGMRIDLIDKANYLSTINSTNTALSAEIQNSAQATLIRAANYTDANAANLQSTLSLVASNLSYLSSSVKTDQAVLINTIALNSTNTAKALTNIVNTQTSTNTGLSNNLQLLLSTGVTSQIYKTFQQLESYSAGVVDTSVKNLNTSLSTSLSSYTSFTQSSVQAVSNSTFVYFTNNIAQSTLNSVSSIVQLNLISTVSNITNTFSTQVVVLNSTNIATVSTYLYNNTLSTITLIANSVSTMSTVFNSQYQMAPSIIMNSTDNITHLKNIQAPDGSTSLSTCAVNLDITKYNNFYLLVSDISSDVFYGLTYSPTTEMLSKDITLQIDIMSSYTNKYLTIDTAALSSWLDKPTIYNQGPTTLYDKTLPQIYLSTFIGAHIVQMRLNMNKLYIRDIITIPYIYTNMSLNLISVNSNLSVSDPRLANSTFVFSNTRMPISWNTNDLNVEVGLKFEGVDICGNIVEKWTGPYRSSDKIANVLAPVCIPFATYTKINIGVYPPQGYAYAPASGNINSPNKNQMFDTVLLDNPLYVYTPTVNSKITVFNPGDVDKVLEIGELDVFTEKGINAVGPKLDHYVEVVSTYSRPYQGDYVSWKVAHMFDGNTNTSFRGGRDIKIIDKNAYVAVSLKSKPDTDIGSQAISSIAIFGSFNNESRYTIEGMKMRIENKNVKGLADGLFYREVTLDNYTPNIVTLR